MIFTAGAPGSGKTYVLHKLFGLDSLHHLDLDAAMRGHPNFGLGVYDRRSAYDWADMEVERQFVDALERRGPLADCGTTTICVDGTGTNVDRALRRMRMAREKGWWVVLLYVRVSKERCVERNTRRERKVPVKTIEEYLSVLEDAVRSVVFSGEGLVNEFIECNNEDDEEAEKEELDRWGASWAKVSSSNETNRRMFDVASTDDDEHQTHWDRKQR